MADFEMISTRLWKDTLGEEASWCKENGKQVEVLRAALLALRKNVSAVAEHIARYLPNYPIHDVRHADALWDIAGTILSNVSGTQGMNPFEGFIFGGAVLLHDLGLACVACQQEPGALMAGPQWQDILEHVVREHLGRRPTAAERQHPPEAIRNEALEFHLRNLHAERAQHLLKIDFVNKDNQKYQLLEDHNLRDYCAETIGALSASHWWPMDEVEARFSGRTLKAPSPCPDEWSANLLRVALLLRVADAASIDSRRAPALQRILHAPKADSDKHWAFQGRLARPQVADGCLTFNSTSSFAPEDMEAWWLAHETLQMVDRELRGADAALKRNRLASFTCSSVKGIESPQHLAETIKVVGWAPIDARIFVSDVPRLVESLGGNQLYGNDPTVPLRELIQNACDAIRARRYVDRRGIDFGKVVVRLGRAPSGQLWIEVEDNGIGMTHHVLTKDLLDFGSTYWRSARVMKEHSGLVSSGFQPTGRFGIGFFSVFMLSREIEVTTRSVNASPIDTLILSFKTGLRGRPVLSKAHMSDQLREPGTKVRLYLADTTAIGLMLQRLGSGRKWPVPSEPSKVLGYICRAIAPCLDVVLSCEVDGRETILSHADDWRTIPPRELLLRITGYGAEPPPELERMVNACADLVREIHDSHGNLLARACMHPLDQAPVTFGVVTCGGLRMARMDHVAGVFVGEASVANRLQGEPLARGKLVADWATEQGHLIAKAYSGLDPTHLNRAAQAICAIGGHTVDLPICETPEGWLSYNDIRTRAWPEMIVLNAQHKGQWSRIHKYAPNTVFLDRCGCGVLNSFPFGGSCWPLDAHEQDYYVADLVLTAIAESWGFSIAPPIKTGHFHFWDRPCGERRVIGQDEHGKDLTDIVRVLRKPMTRHKGPES